MPPAERYTIWIHDRKASNRGLFPKRGQVREEVVAQLLDLPTWTDSVYIHDESSGRQVFLAFVNRQTSDQEHRVALDVLVVPNAWVESLPNRPHRTDSRG
jgi:1,6-anhydro-N-acetylmuramate kinase